MSTIRRLEGLKFPDEMVTRFFFRERLDRRVGRVLELGCGNANNLGLFAAFDWECVGLDISVGAIDQGKKNFVLQGYAPPRLEVADLNQALPYYGALDVLLLPSSIYYVRPERARAIISGIGGDLKPGANIFCRFRTPEDYRYGKGEEIDPNCFRLEIEETSERGCVNAFYSVDSMLDLLSPCEMDPASLRVFDLIFDNLGAGNKIIRNAEKVIWGRRYSD